MGEVLAPPDLNLLRTVPPALVHLQPPVWRIHREDGGHGAPWDQWRAHGPMGTARWDHWLGEEQDRDDAGVAYVALDQRSPFAEVFQVYRTVDCRPPEEGGADLRLTSWVPTRPLVCLDLTGVYPTMLGAMHLLNCGPRAVCREWSQAFFEVFGGYVDGLQYVGMLGEPCLFLYPRAHDSVPPEYDRQIPLSSPEGQVLGSFAAGSVGYDYAPDTLRLAPRPNASRTKTLEDFLRG